MRTHPVGRRALVCGLMIFAAFFVASLFQPRVFGASVHDFDDSVDASWSTRDTYRIGQSKVLGLFNDRNRKYKQGTHLTIDNIPDNAKVKLSFDLYLIGTWDSGGKLGDRWTMTIRQGSSLIDMNAFPSAYQDKEETIPIGNQGSVIVGNRDLAYWIVPQEVTIAPHQMKGKSLILGFRGYLTGRKTEFWALDNVQIRFEE